MITIEWTLISRNDIFYALLIFIDRVTRMLEEIAKEETAMDINEVNGGHELQHESSSLRCLWLEVFHQALRDIRRGDSSACSWLNKKDFIICCQLAGLDNPDKIRAYLKNAHQRGATFTA